MVFERYDGPAWIVFYAPLSQVWVFREDPFAEGATVNVTARVLREEGKGFGTVVVHHRDWNVSAQRGMHGPETLSNAALAAANEGYHPLAEFHDRLLSKPLGSPLGNLPAGSRFVPVVVSGPGGIVERPDSPTRVTLWESLGDLIAITHPDGIRTVHGWREVDAALEGGAE